MDRKAFGRLLAALRDEMGWTQAQLSELVDEEEAVISQLERGAKKQIDPALLFRLANVFQLTTLERREFFLAAVGMETKDLVRQPGGGVETDVYDAAKTLARAVDLLEKLPLPGFIIDSFGDVLAANAIVIGLLQVPPLLMEQAPHVPGGYSTVRLTYGESMAAMIADGYEAYAINSIRTFRETSLRYRAHPYFQYLLKEFRNPKKYPRFEHFWRKAAVLDADKSMSLDSFRYTHATFGPLTYYASSSVFCTVSGELYLYQYTPLDDRTGDVFRRIHEQAGNQAVRFAPWPEKNMP